MFRIDYESLRVSEPSRVYRHRRARFVFAGENKLFLEKFTLVAFAAKVPQRPVDHELGLRGAVHGNQDLAQGHLRLRLRFVRGGHLRECGGVCAVSRES